MKVLVVLCVIVACAAGHPGYLGHGYGLPQQVGDTHEVAVAKAQHFAAVEEAKIRNAQASHGLDHGYGSLGHSGAVSHIHIEHPHSYGHGGGYGGHYGGYSGHLGYATGHEVEVATAQHLAAHAKEAARHAHGSYDGGYGAYGGYGGQYGHGLAPGQDTHEVAVAKAKHFAAHAEAKARNGLGGGHYGGSYAYASPYGYGGHGLAPGQDTHEVAHAKALHFAAHAEAKARNGWKSY